MLGSVLTQPMDTLQTLLKSNSNNKGLRLLCYDMVRQNGPMSLMSGLMVRMAKIVPNSIIV